MSRRSNPKPGGRLLVVLNIFQLETYDYRSVRGGGRVCPFVIGMVGAVRGTLKPTGWPGFSTTVAAGGSTRQCEKSGGQGQGFQQGSK